jgi:uncharacterized membrane protein YfcA
MDILRFVMIGLSVGLLSGTVGIGGGVLMLPALIWICGQEPRQAAGTTLAVLVVPVVLPAAYDYWSRGYVDLKAAGWIALAFAVGGYTGAALRNEQILPEGMLRLCLGLIMIYIAISLIINSDSEVMRAAVGVTATVLAWLAYLRLRAIGRQTLPPRKLRDQMRRLDDQDYHI